MADRVFGRNWSLWMADTVLEKFTRLGEQWSYGQGVLCKGLEMIYEETGDKKYFDYIKNYADAFVLEDGTIRNYQMEEYNLDHINNGKVLLYLYKATGEAKYLEAAGHLRRQLEGHPRTSDGGFWHKKMYPWQMWLDGLYMAEPFYAEYIREVEQTGDYSDVLHQFELIERHSRDPKTHLLYHGWDDKRESFWADKETGCSAHFWGRSIGWYACAMVDVLDYLEDEKDRKLMTGFVKDLAEGLLKVQSPENGLWYQVMDQRERFGNYPESSCSCMFVYFLLKSVRLGYIGREYLQAAKRGFLGIIGTFIEVDPDGLLNLRDTVFVSGLGGDHIRDGSYDYYISEPKQTNNMLGVGAFLMASAEYEKVRETLRKERLR